MNTLVLLNNLMTPLDITNTASGWLKIAGTIAISIVSILIIVSIVKNVWDYVKGQGSTSAFAIIGKVIFLILMIGLIVLIQTGAFTKTAKTTGGKLINQVNNAAVDLIDANDE